MNNETKAPTLDEFIAATRNEFRFLTDHGFVEVPQPKARHQNPFEVHYAREGWRVIVEGLSFGFCAGTLISSPDGRKASFGHIVPSKYWKEHREGLGRGQLGDIRYQAMTLKEFGKDFLEGDASIMDELCLRTKEYIERDRQYWKQRDMERAITNSAKAFRLGSYQEVINLLEDYEDNLPKSQVAKLKIARKKTNG